MSQPAPFDRWSLWRILTAGLEDVPLTTLKPTLLLLTGTADSGTTTTLIDAARTEADKDYFRGAVVTFTSGNNSGLSREVIGFDPSTDKLIFGTALPVAVTTENYDITIPKRGEAGLMGIICVRPYSEIMIKAFGTNANDDTFGMMIYGMMDNGPLTKILDLNCILGASSFAEPFIDNGRVPSDTYFEVDTYDEAGGDDLVGGSAPTASTGSGTIGSFYRIPTLGFKYLMIQLIDKDGTTGVEATAAGVIWRPTIPRVN